MPETLPQEQKEIPNIPRYELKNPAPTIGKDIFGRLAKVTLEHADRPGWFVKVGDEDVEIKMDNLKTERHHLFLEVANSKGETKKVRIVEHLLPLRFIGLDSVRIVADTEWLPYDGGGMIFWNAIEGKIKSSGELSAMKQNANVSFGKFENNLMERRVSFKTDNNLLKVKVNIDHPILGAGEGFQKTFPLQSPEAMLDLLSSKPLGVPIGGPKWLEYFLWTASNLGWPHYDKLFWHNKDEDPKEILKRIAEHRMLDFLGALAVIPNAGEYLLGTAISYNGNHSTDIELNRAIEKFIKSESK